LNRVKNTLYIEADTNAALRDYARRKRLSVTEAMNQLLRIALFDQIDEGTEAMLVPEIRKAVREAARREIQENMSRLLGVQTDRLFGVLVTCGRDAYVARKLAKDVLDDSTGSAQWANDREQDALLASRRPYTREGLREAASEER